MSEFASKKNKYKIEGDKFIITPNNPRKSITSALLDKKDKVIEYTNKQDNKIIEVISIEKNSIVTKYYDSWYPLVLIKPHTIFYSKDECKDIADRYLTLLQDLDKTKKLLNNICSEYDKFTEYTGLHFNDKASNNILVNKDISDFRIIDICSLNSHSRGPLSKNSHKRLLGYYRWIYIYDEYFTQIQIDNLLAQYE